MSNTYTQVFGGSAIYPSDVSYLAITLSSNIVLDWPLEATGANNVVARIIDVATTGIYTIAMPDATNVGVGQTVLFNNLGPDIVTVNNAAGNALLSLSPGQQWQLYLIDNTTAAGQWRSFRYGAAVAQAQASALAGPGLTALGSELAQNIEVVAFNISPLTVTSADRAKAFVWTGALGTLALPNISAAGAGWSVQVRNNGSGDLTIDPAGTQTINSGLTLTLRPGDSALVVTDGVEWFTVGLGQQPVFAFDYTVIALTGGTYTLSASELNRIAYKFTGALSSNVTVLVPATVQQYWVNNATTGPYALSIGAVGGGTPVVAPQGESNIYYCDGTNIVQATTTASFGGTLSVGQGGTGATTPNGALTNLGGTGTGIAVFTAASAAAGRTALSAASIGANSDITSFTGLTTPLSVAQGGTGSAIPAGARANLGAAAAGSNGDITALTATGGISVGAPAGGAQGTGTLNATGLFINGVAVGTGAGSVTSVQASGGTTGLTFSGGPITTSGTLTVGGALVAANGGTGQTTYSSGQLLIGKADGTLAKATLTAGTNVTITNGDGTITINASGGGGGGTVTSVQASGGTTGLSFSGGPITTSGTLTLGGTLDIANGGTGAATPSGARLALGAATSGPATTSGLTMATARILGRTTAGTGAIEEIVVGSGLSMSAGTLSATGSVTSVSGSGGATGLTLTGGPITTTGTLTIGGTLAVASGGTGATDAATARANLGGTTVGANLFTLADPSAVRFVRLNADNTVSALSDSAFRTAIGAGTGNGTVTSVSGTGTVNGITLTGSVTGSGNLTLGGSVSNVSLTTQVTGILPVANGGTGTSTAFTAGSVVFADGSGVYTQNNSNLFWDLTSNRLGIRTNSPGFPLTVNGEARADKFTTSAGAQSLASATNLTILTVTGATPRVWLVCMAVDAAPGSEQTVALVVGGNDGSGGPLLSVTQLANGVVTDVTVSGGSIIVQQTTGITQAISWSITRIM